MEMLMFYSMSPTDSMPDVLFNGVASAFSDVPAKKIKKFIEKSVGKIKYEPFNGKREAVFISVKKYSNPKKNELQKQIINLIKDAARKNGIACTTLGCASRKRLLS